MEVFVKRNKLLWLAAFVVGFAFWCYAITSDDPILRCQALPNCDILLVNSQGLRT
ncbi:hypothetical protein JXVLWARM_CDS_0101 [Burkholderia phage Bm1]